jgi:hypothetical protein
VALTMKGTTVFWDVTSCGPSVSEGHAVSICGVEDVQIKQSADCLPDYMQ